MIKAVQVVTLLLATIGSVYSQGNATCLDVKLWDTFGDGWAGAMAWLERPSGDLTPSFPTCVENPVLQQVCPDEDGKYYIVVTTEDNELPRHFWEIVWTVSLTNATDNTTETYTGGYNTTMVWDYDGATDTWSLVYYNNLWPNTKACEGCGDSSACAPKPKHKKHKKRAGPKKGKGKGGKGKGKGKDDDEDEDDDELVVNVTNATELTPAPKYGPRAVNLAVTMWDEEGDGWWLDDYTGASWYISDYSNTVLYDSGTLCDGDNGVCKICLGDGPYVFRVTGEDLLNNFTNFTTWDFCGTSGDFSDELHFHVFHGKCYPDLLVEKDDVCAGGMTSTILVEGVLAVSGISTEFFSAEDAKVVADVLSTEIATLNSNSVNVLSSTLESATASSGRKLSTYTHYVSFDFTLVAEELGVDGTNMEYVNNIVSAIESTIQSKISSGEFLENVFSFALQDGAKDMSSVTAVSLVSLQLNSVSYSHSKVLPSGIQYSEEETASYSSSSSSNYDTSSIVVFVSCVGVALAVFGGIVANRMKGYSHLAQESTHGLFEVGATEMDSSISNLVLSRHKTGNLEASL